MGSNEPLIEKVGLLSESVRHSDQALLLNLRWDVVNQFSVRVGLLSQAVGKQVWSLTQFYSADFTQPRTGVNILPQNHFPL